MKAVKDIKVVTELNAKRTPVSIPSLWLALAALTVLALAALSFQACAPTKSSLPGQPTNKKSSVAAPVKVDEGSDLADLAKGLKTTEDLRVLELLMGYRMLLLQNQNPKALDKETLKKSRQAFERLESMLRHGGIRTQDGGERVYQVTDEDRLSLLQVLESASESANKNAKDGDWEKARARWKEMVQSKPALNFILEEAQWGIVLADALQSSLPDSIKRSLKEVNESHVAEISHDEIAKQVRALLGQVSDIKIQRELKKLANRSWERDKRAGRSTGNQVVQTEPPELRANASDSVKSSATLGSQNPNSTPSIPPASAVGSSPSQSPSPPVDQSQALSAEAIGIGAKADTLVLQGKYMAAFKVLEMAGEQAWVKEKKTQIGDRFCEEKRKSAANAFKDFKKAGADSLKRIHLKHTAADLDSCLFYFPELAITQKVRKNREMVETELKKLKL